MKRVTTLFLSALLALGANAQTKAKPKPTTTIKKTTASQPLAVNTLKTLADSASYAIGQNIAQSISKDLKTLNKAAFLNAIKTVFDGQTPKFNESDIRSILASFSQQEQESQSKTVIDEGRAFLAKNKNNPKIQTTASGLQYEVLKEGTGAKPTASDSVVCHYKGMLLDSTEFDNSYERGEPITIGLGNVIPGWTEGLQLMSTGSKYRFFIPYELGYGLHGAGSIPGGAVLIFDIELLDIKKSS